MRALVFFGALCLSLLAFSFAQEISQPTLVVGTLASSGGQVEVLLIVKVPADRSLEVIDARGPTGVQVMPAYWFPHDSGAAGILVAPCRVPAEAGEYVVSLAGDPPVSLSAHLTAGSPLDVPLLQRLEISASSARIVWRAVEGAVEYSVSTVNHDSGAIEHSETVEATDVTIPIPNAVHWSVIIRAYDFAFGDPHVWPANPRISELQVQAPLVPPG